MSRATAFLAGAVLLFALLAATLWWFAPEIAVLAITRLSRDAGLPPLVFRVDQVNSRNIHLSEVRLESGELASESIVASWTLGGLRQGRLLSIDISGLVLRGHTTEDGISFGALDPWLRNDGDTEVIPIPAERLRLRDARVQWVGGTGTEVWTADADLRLEPVVLGTATVKWDAAKSTRATLDLAIDREGSLTASLALDAHRDALARWTPGAAANGPTRIAAKVDCRAHRGSPITLGDVFGDTPGGATGDGIERGACDFALEASEVLLAEDGPMSMEASGRILLDKGRVHAEIPGIQLRSDFHEPREASVAVDARLDGKDLVFDSFSISGPTALLIDRKGIVSAQGRARIRGTDLTATFDLHADLDATRDRAAASIRGPVELTREGESLRVRLPECLDISLAAGPFAASLGVTDAATLCATTRANEAIRVAFPSAAPSTIDAELQVSASHAAIGGAVRGEAPWLRASDLRSSLEITGSLEAPTVHVRLKGSSIELPQSLLRLEAPDLAGRWDIATSRFAGKLGGRRWIDRRRAPQFPPLVGSIDFEGEPARIAFVGQATDATGSLSARFGGTHEIDSGAGRATLTSEPLVFGANRATLAALRPWIGPSVHIAEGRIGVMANMTWDSERLRARAEIDIADANIEASGVRIETLSGLLRFVDLDPLTTEPRQQIRFGSATNGVAAGSDRVVFTVEPEQILRIHESAIALAGGTLRISGSVDLEGGAAQRLNFAVAGVDLARLLELVPVDGLEATGRLSGEMQLGVVDGRPVLSGGVLRALEGGRIQYGAGAESNAGAGGPTAVLFQVMRDFYYDSMNVSIAGQLDQGATVQVRIRGRSPSFQDGHPVNLTLNISTAFKEAVDAIPQARALLEWLATPNNVNTHIPD